MDTEPVRLFTTPDEAGLSEALETLAKAPHLQIEKQICPTTMGEWFICPYLQAESGTFFGLEGIRFFVKSRMTAT